MLILLIKKKVLNMLIWRPGNRSRSVRRQMHLVAATFYGVWKTTQGSRLLWYMYGLPNTLLLVPKIRKVCWIYNLQTKAYENIRQSSGFAQGGGLNIHKAKFGYLQVAAQDLLQLLQWYGRVRCTEMLFLIFMMMTFGGAHGIDVHIISRFVMTLIGL